MTDINLLVKENELLRNENKKLCTELKAIKKTMCKYCGPNSDGGATSLLDMYTCDFCGDCYHRIHVDEWDFCKGCKDTHPCPLCDDVECSKCNKSYHKRCVYLDGAQFMCKHCTKSENYSVE